jgi:Fe-S-cluster-containing hydrogenase component 2
VPTEIIDNEVAEVEKLGVEFRYNSPVDRSSPCTTCQEKPCIGACPANALDGGNFSLQKCIAYRRRTGSKCQFTCLARVDCPVGAEHRYDDEQLRHSYGRSLEDLKKYF